MLFSRTPATRSHASGFRSVDGAGPTTGPGTPRRGAGFSQKHKSFGGNIQFLSAPDGTPLWISDVEPRSTPDITATRLHVLPALYKAAADGLPTLADKGYIGAGVGIRVSVRRPKGRSEKALDIDTRTTNALIRHVRALGERAAAELKERWRTLKRISLSPTRIGDIARAAPVLNNHWK
ncbi:transposase family protein [Streptomyces sp. NPDC056390]|uniref:transposase family protein n=1 Tax=Streptomyces sp. NPDC056390 TaxID=3345806 RepID=UPI0035DA83C7